MKKERANLLLILVLASSFVFGKNLTELESIEPVIFQSCQNSYNLCLDYNCKSFDNNFANYFTSSFANYYCRRSCLFNLPPECLSYWEILPLNCTFEEITVQPPWTNEKLTHRCTYNQRSFVLLGPGMISRGRFDWLTVNPCRFDKEFYLYLPEGQHEHYQLFILIHDSYGFAEDELNFVLNNNGQFNKKFFDEKGIAILAPQFNFYSSNCAYRNFDLFFSNYNSLENHRSDQWLLFLVDYLQQKIPTIKTERFYLFGHSKGAQFLSAFTAAYPQKIQAAVFSAGGFYVGGDLLHESYLDLNFNFSELFQNHLLTLVVGEKDLDRRKCAAKKYVCNTVKKYCAFDETPYFDCEEIWNAPKTVLLFNSSTYCFNFGQENCNLEFNPCYGRKPEILGTAKCNFTFRWVPEAEHSMEKNYLLGAKLLFR